MKLLGKAPARHDERTLKLGAMLKDLPEPPKVFDLDSALKLPTPMLGNDKFGCCVIAARGHQTLRSERAEQGVTIKLRAQDVVNQYFKESKGQDSGLIMLDSLKSWRKEGWPVAGRRYLSHAFGSVNYQSDKRVRQALFYLRGLQLGFALPETASEQFDAGKPWTVGSSTAGRKGSWGGHAIYIPPICTPTGLIGITWGKPQPMTWDFFCTYADEAYAVVDAKDAWLGAKSPLDLTQLNAQLAAITG